MHAISSNHRKYLTRNPFKRFLIEQFNSRILRSIDALTPSSLLEVGCGEGFMTSQIREAFPETKMEALDINDRALQIAQEANPDVTFHCAGVEQLAFEDESFDLVLCAEVLEHLPGFGKAMTELCRVSKRDIILSVPNEPYFRIMNFLALGHFRTLGNPPDHLRHWSKDEFVHDMESYLHIDAVYSPFPWTIIVGKKK